LIETKDTTSLLSDAAASERTLPSLPLSRRLASAISLVGLGSIMTMAVSTIANVILARNAGPSGYAVYVAANMLVFVTAVVCELGLPVALAKYSAVEEEEGRHEKLKHTVPMVICLALLLTLLVGTLIAFIVPHLEIYSNVPLGGGFLIVFPLILLGAVVSDCIQGVYTGLLRARALIVITTTGPLVMIAYILVRRTAGVSLPIWGAVAAFYICCGVVAIYKAWRDRLLGTPARLGLPAPILKDLAPAATFTFFIIFSSWSDRWIASTQMGAAVLGSYAAAVVIIQAVLRVPVNIAYMLVPASSKVALGGSDKSRVLNRTVIGAFSTFAFFMTVVIMLAPSTIVRLIFGPGFALSALPLLIMALSLPASAISIPFISRLTGSTKNRMVIYLLGFTLVPRILLLIFMTRRWSLAGTALATILADYLLAICCVILARTTGMGFPLGALMRPALIGLLAFTVGIGALFLNAPQPVAIALATAVFVPSFLRAAQSLRNLAG
jgi:O-antigen/teichoic acid export membrane protein